MRRIIENPIDEIKEILDLFADFSNKEAVKNVSTKEFGVSIFPNPASNQLHILATIPAKEPIFIRVLDMTGKEILSDKIQNGAQEKTFSIQSIPAGIYLIQCYNESFSTFEKLVKE